MRETADVRSFEALKDAKAALLEFREVVGVALSEAESEIQRTLWWLQHDQANYWRHEVRRRTELVNQAKSELYRAKLAAMDDRAPCTEQRKLLEKAERRLQEAVQKIELVKKWSRLLDRERLIYKGQTQALAREVDAEIPQAEAKLETMMDRLEAYVRLHAPQHGEPKNRFENEQSAPDSQGQTASDSQGKIPGGGGS